MPHFLFQIKKHLKSKYVETLQTFGGYFDEKTLSKVFEIILDFRLR